MSLCNQKQKKTTFIAVIFLYEIFWGSAENENAYRSLVQRQGGGGWWGGTVRLRQKQDRHFGNYKYEMHIYLTFHLHIFEVFAG